MPCGDRGNPDNGIDNTLINSVDVLSDGSIITGLFHEFGALHFSQEGVFDSTFDLTQGLSELNIGYTFGAFSAVDGTIFLAGNSSFVDGPANYYFSVAARIEGDGLVRPAIHFTLPDSAGESEAIPLTADIDTLPNRPIISYQWDLDYNGVYFVADLTGPNASIDPWTFNGPSSHVIAMRVVDSEGLASIITTTTINITNSAPAPDIDLAYGAQTPFFINDTVPVDLSVIDAPGDIVNRWSVSWGDGITQLFVNKPTSLTHAYAAAGTYEILVTARDNNNAISDPASLTVKIYACPQIEGTVYLDNNSNGVKNSTESGMSGVLLWLDENNNGILDNSEPSATTDANGYYYLVDLPVASASRFRIQTPEGYRNTTAKSFLADNLPEDQTLALNFGLTNRVNLTGTIFHDKNRNRRLDSKDLLLANVRLYIDSNNNGALDFDEKSVLTNSKGVYRFNNIVAGRHYVRAVLPKTLRTLTLGTPKSNWWVNLDIARISTTRNFYFVD